MNIVRIVRQTSVLASIVLTSLSIYSNPASAQQRACVITDEGTTVCGKITTPNKKPIQSSGYRKEVDKFVILFKGCRKSSDTTVKCDFVITNKGEERKLYFRAYRDSSQIIDSTGKSYPASKVEVGGRIDDDNNETISPGIDYEANFIFENIPTRITQIPLLKVQIGKELQFRNISFSN